MYLCVCVYTYTVRLYRMHPVVLKHRENNLYPKIAFLS